VPAARGHSMKLRELARILGAELSGPGDREIIGVAGVQDAGEGYITFLAGKNFLKELEQSRASAVLVSPDTPEMPLPALRVKNPRLAFARAIELFYVKPYSPSGVSDKAVIGNAVTIGENCSVHPFVVLDDRARIGHRVTIYPGSYVGQDSFIDDDSVIYANVSIGCRITVGKRVVIHSGAVIGSDGFGFVTDGGIHHKIPQVGGVVIEDDVEIGANCSIDRATLGNTLIKKGTKLDNQVHVAHNVTIGEHCLLAGQSGIAGSSTLGDYVVLAGQAGVADHTTVGDRVMAGGKAVITQDVEAGRIIAGFNAMPIRDWLKVQAVLPKLPELKKMLIALEKQLNELKERIPDRTKGARS
jgi:UDP-3-O-[3-hydroxymyristoyl] glucosamine N-acyltransferase